MNNPVIALKYIFALTLFFVVSGAVLAADLTSGSFIIRDPVLGTGSGYSSSASFSVQGSGNLNTQGYGSSASFIGEYGFLYYQAPVVSQSITFELSDSTLAFGSLSSSSPRFATGTSGSGTDSVAHTIVIETTAPSGYSLRYTGLPFSSGASVIDAATIVNDEDGTSGVEQFGISASVSDDADVAVGYDHNATPANRDWKFVANTPVTIVSEDGQTAAETINLYYLANIAASTPAGQYATEITYTVTGNF